MTSTPNRWSSITTSLPSSPEPSSRTRVACGLLGVPIETMRGSYHAPLSCLGPVMRRREFLWLSATSALLAATRAHAADGKMNTRAIPRTGELLPSVGLGTWQTFDVGLAPTSARRSTMCCAKFLAAGVKLIDSSPMYGRAEEVTGDELAAIGAIGKPFLATKVWTTGKREGIEQMERSMKRMRTDEDRSDAGPQPARRKTHLPVLREMEGGGHDSLPRRHALSARPVRRDRELMKGEKLDFIQIPYSIVDREAERASCRPRSIPARRCW